MRASRTAGQPGSERYLSLHLSYLLCWVWAASRGGEAEARNALVITGPNEIGAYAELAMHGELSVGLHNSG